MSIHEKFSHIDQLKEWWENADQVAPMRGDLIIEDVTDEYGPDYRIRNWPGDMKEKLSYVRVLEPKPKPAWHDALAVIATYGHIEGFITRGPLLNVGKGAWRAVDGCLSQVGQLHDVTPLIPAEVTDEMVVRFLEEDNGRTDIGVLLAAALGAEKV